MKPIIHRLDPQRDLIFERIIDIQPEAAWTAWTIEEHLKQWFTPAPWKTVDCEIDLAPGGIFRTVMLSPEGQEFPNVGCYLEIVPNEKLVWTNALEPGFRPAAPQSPTPCETFFFTATITLEPHKKGTKYTALVMHQDEEGCRKHRQMGFHEGWGKSLDQLVAYMKSL